MTIPRSRGLFIPVDAPIRDTTPTVTAPDVADISVTATLTAFAPFVVPTIQVEKKEEGSVSKKAPARVTSMPELLTNDTTDTETEERNNNEAILALHKAGKSNMAIARELGLGVGEVKLVIDLFKGM